MSCLINGMLALVLSFTIKAGTLYGICIREERNLILSNKLQYSARSFILLGTIPFSIY